MTILYYFRSVTIIKTCTMTYSIASLLQLCLSFIDIIIYLGSRGQDAATSPLFVGGASQASPQFLGTEVQKGRGFWEQPPPHSSGFLRDTCARRHAPPPANQVLRDKSFKKVPVQVQKVARSLDTILWIHYCTYFIQKLHTNTLMYLRLALI